MPHSKTWRNGSTRAWRKLRAQVVKEEPLCWLRLPGCTIYSTSADHIIPVSIRPDLKMERPNLKGVCHTCNVQRGNRHPAVARAKAIQAIQRSSSALSFFGPTPNVRTCAICGAPFTASPSNPKRTCGVECGQVLRNRNQQARIKPKPTPKQHHRSCDHCGQAFTTTRSNQKRCSRECSYEVSKRDENQRIKQRYHTDPEFRARCIAATKKRQQQIKLSANPL